MSREPSLPARSPRATFSPVLGGVAIAVEAADVATLAWLAEFFVPTMRIVARGVREPDHLVTVTVSRSRAATLARRFAHTPATDYDLFTLDGAFDRVRGWAAPDGWTWVSLRDLEVFVGVGREAQRVEVVAARAGRTPRLATMRVVRELATSALLRAGHVPLHAAAFVLNGGAVVVAGEKRAGKTTLLVQALHAGATCLANDRVVCTPARPRRVAGVATLVMLRLGTLDRFPDLGRAYAASRYDRARTVAECAPGVRRPVPRPGVGRDLPGLSAAQFHRLTGARARGVAPLRAILFPTIAPGTPGLALRRLSPAAATRRLAHVGLKPGPDLLVSQLLAAPGPRHVRSRREEAAALRRLAAEVPAYACRLGASAHLADLRAALRDAGVIASPPRRARRPRSAGR